MSRTPRIARLALFAAAALATPACGPASSSDTPDLLPAATCTADARGEKYAAGMQHVTTNKLYTVVLVSSDPGPPAKGNDTWIIKVTDAAGAPVAGAKVSVLPFMPDHGHGTSRVVDVTDQGGGQYQLTPLNFFMAGVWRTTVTIDAAAGVDQALFYFCIEG